ncbi:hypothetical protein [Nocardia abscessus]|uniref:hypothetical protein n=1 Tax=Nocardia abscessus TaxID=120957 RepID=UPI002456CDDB|nr:hypothetical protein [Nocardia abscessus]
MSEVAMKAWLEGERVSLCSLAELLPEGDIRIAGEDVRYYLSSPMIDEPREGETFYEAAQRLLVVANGLGRVMSSGFTPVTLAGTYSDEGNVHVVVGVLTARATASVNAVVVSVDGVDVPQPPPMGPRYAEQAMMHPEVAEVLRILALPNEDLGWGELYKAYEILQGKIPKAIRREDPRISGKKESLFTTSANHPGSNGEYIDVRHARAKGDPPGARMSKSEGRQFISTWVGIWLDYLSAPNAR